MATGIDKHVRTGTVRVLATCLAIGAILSSCTPPTIPDPGIITAPPGSGIDPAVGVAPSMGCAEPRSNRATVLGAAERSTVRLSVGGKTRKSLLDVPAGGDSSDAIARPLVVSLHPFLLDATTWDDYSGIAAEARDRGYIVVTPFGSDPGPRWSVPGGLDTGVDDLAFIAALLDRIEADLCVDRNRVFAVGFSAGAAMAQALSCVMPDRFRGVAGSGGMNLTTQCPHSPATDVLLMHGTADPIVPIGGSTIPFTPPTGIGVGEVVATNANRAGCDPVPVVDRVGRRTTRSRFVGCAGAVRIESLLLGGAGHTWAGSPNLLLELAGGPTNRDISATDTVLDFFDAR